MSRICAELDPEIERTGATVTIGDLPVVPGDPHRLTQVLQNLLTNALKFGADGVPLQISIEAEADGDEWIVTVRDNGVGIADAELDTVFAAFTRGSAGEVQPGHGLGLSICRRIVEKHRLLDKENRCVSRKAREKLLRSLPDKVPAQMTLDDKWMLARRSALAACVA